MDIDIFSTWSYFLESEFLIVIININIGLFFLLLLLLDFIFIINLFYFIKSQNQISYIFRNIFSYLFDFLCYFTNVSKYNINKRRNVVCNLFDFDWQSIKKNISFRFALMMMILGLLLFQKHVNLSFFYCAKWYKNNLV